MAVRYPDPVDAQVIAPWSEVDRFRAAYARAHALALAAEKSRRQAERLLSKPHRSPVGERYHRRYADFMRQLVAAQRTAWRLYGDASRRGPKAVEAAERARRSVEALAQHRLAARDARLYIESMHMTGG